MRRDEFTDDAPGVLVQTDGNAWAFIPDALPTSLTLSAQVILQVEQTTLAVGRLDQLGRSLLNPYLLIRPFIRREAVASSRMEGTTADLGQLVLYEVFRQPDRGDSDVQEVANYVEAVDYGLRRPQDRPVSMGLVREMHQILLTGVRGQQFLLGDLRDRQNWISGPTRSIGDARFIPPPPHQVPGLLRDLEHYWQTPNSLPALIRLALIHYQFETIHPFFDGNGRLGRLLMAVLLDDWQLLAQPLLYLSTAIERSREEYHDGMLKLSQTGKWDDWIMFFLRAARESADDALDRGNRLITLRETYRTRYTGGATSTPLQVIDLLFETPAFTTSELAQRIGISFGAVQKAVERLSRDRVLREATGQPRNRIYVATEILEIVDTNVAAESDSTEHTPDPSSSSS